MIIPGLERFTQVLKERLSVPPGTSNQVLGVDAQRRFTSHPLIKETPIVTNSDELAQLQGSGGSQNKQMILDFSGKSDFVQPDDNVKLWQLNNNQWQSSNTTVRQLIDQGILTRSWLHYNATTGRYFMVDKNRKVFMDTIFQ